MYGWKEQISEKNFDKIKQNLQHFASGNILFFKVIHWLRSYFKYFPEKFSQVMYLTKDVDWAPTRNHENNSIGMATVKRISRSVRRQIACICSKM